ncbi:putative MFS family arabinose efflux permease [Nocardiopsis terrae]|uniref:MFS family arabinose efflux permease n=1 Tax=Nocardiopsis terrae TaxID=372655 RepID=A0ABR9HKT9_9ACTN|nr:MFS transporter [Nocardiopsis terrae]MBE1459633.1 putative MFS family arabinose efflux permease [Nocardiopsis terrae]
MSTTQPNAGVNRRQAPASRPFAVPALSLTGVLVVGQLYSVLPLLAPVARDWGADQSTVAWTVTAFAIAYATGFLVSGPAADRFGPRRVIIAGGLATAALTGAVALAPGAAAGLALRALQGFAAASFAPAAFSYIATRVEAERRVTAITWLTSSFLAAAVIGQLAAQALEQSIGWQGVFAASAAALAVAALGLRFVLAPDQSPQPSGGGAVSGMLGLLRDRRLLLLYGATATVLLGFVGVYSGLQLSGPAWLTGDAQALLTLRASALPAMLAVPLLSSRLARYSPGTRVPAALIGAAVTAAVTGLVADLGPVALGVSLLAFAGCVAVAAPALIQAIGMRAGAARGSATALYTFALFVGAGLGPQLATVLSELGFTAVALGTAAVLAVGGALALAALLRRAGD